MHDRGAVVGQLSLGYIAPMLLLLLVACGLDPKTDTRRATPGDTPTVSTSTVHGPDDSGTPPTDSGPTDSATVPTDSGSTDSGTAPWQLPARPDTDHPAPTDSWRWGGGVGYPDVVDPTWPTVTRVSDLPGLSGALSTATAGTIVWIEGDAELDLTGQHLCVPGGVWVASDRGVGAGALLFSTVGAADPILEACGDDVRITGLRLRGPDPETCPSEWPSRCPNDVSGDSNCAYCTDTAIAIRTTEHAGLEVDNNELSGWTYAAIGVHNALGADIHHNHIHHGWREGLGYGVVLYGTAPSTALIRWNRMDAMRHAVAGQGYPEEDYEARDNLIGSSAISHVFDMHGENEVSGDGEPWAGGDVRVHGNIVLVPDQYSLAVRGKPAIGSWLYNNCLAPSSGDAYTQRYFSGNFYVDEAPDGTAAPNTYGQDASDCGTLYWCLADGVNGPLRYGSASGTAASNLLIGDLDGDGRDDVFGTDGSRWRWANPDGGTWTSLASSGVAVSDLALADLDGDGVDDVVMANGDTWSWSRSGSASWATLKSSNYTLDQLRFGDFDGDGAQDIFTTDGARWSYHPRGSGAAINLASSSDPIGDLAVGDFDGDGVSDVFSADGAQWRWSRSGTTTWADLAVSSATVASLGFADVDGDRVTDVLSMSGETLRFSSGGRTSWVTLRHQREGLDELRLGDFNGDGRADVLTGGCL